VLQPSTVRRPFRRPPWSTVHRLPSISRSAVCGPRSILPSVVPHSFIRSPFVDGLPLPTASKTHVQSSPVHRPFRGLSCHPQSLIRLFVPHSLTVCPLPRPPSISRSILPSVVPHSFIRSPFVDGLPLPTALKTHVQLSTVHRPPSISQSILPSVVSRSFIRSSFVDGLPPTPSTVHFAVYPAIRSPSFVYSFFIR
jgi:hypothetical protein